MTPEELNTWMEAVGLHMDTLDKIINDRRILKEELEKHLKQFFQWDEIEYNRDFSRIELSWSKGVNPIIRGNIGELGMDWIIKADYDDKANRIVVIEIYPWGVKEEGLLDP